MEPNNQQVNPVVNQQQVPQVNLQPIVVTSQQQTPQIPQAPKSNKKLLYGILFGVVVIVVIGAVGFYLMKAPKSTPKVAEIAAPSEISTVTPEPEVVVNNESDLDNLLVGLAQADNSLDTELASLEKDSNF